MFNPINVKQPHLKVEIPKEQSCDIIHVIQIIEIENFITSPKLYVIKKGILKLDIQPITFGILEIVGSNHQIIGPFPIKSF